MFIKLRQAILASAAALALAFAVGPAQAQESKKGDPDFFVFGAGYFDINDDMDAVEFRAEYHSDIKLLWIFKPFAGLMGTSDEAFYGYGGIKIDVFFGRRIVLTPSFALGYYEDGDGKDLGYPLEFRSSIELAYRFDDRSRLGLSLYHISNASLGDSNQGTEVLSLSYSLPIHRIFGK